MADIEGRSSAMAIVLGLVALALHLVVGFFVFSSGLVAPLWAVAVLSVIWVVALLIGWRLWRTRPGVALAVPVIMAAIWWLSINAGERFLGWTA